MHQGKIGAAVGSLAFCSLLFFSVGLTRSQTAGPANRVENARFTSVPPVYFLDRNTWNVLDPYQRGTDLSDANTIEKRTVRWKTVLQFEFPDEYQKQFPPTPQEKAAAIAAAFEIEHPQTFDEFLRQPRTPEQTRELEQALESFFSPVVTMD